MKLSGPSTRWRLDADGNAYRSDGYVGIGTDNPTGLLTLETTTITVDDNGILVFTDASGENRFSDPSSFDTSILDGYALESTENQRWIDSSQQLQDLRDAADGYSSITTAQAHDGYIAFFTGTDAIAGDNDLRFDRENNKLIALQAEFSKNVEVKGQIAPTNTSTYTPTGSTQIIDLNTGNFQILSLASAASGDVTVTLSNALYGGSYAIKVIQHATTPVNVIFTGVLWAGGTGPTISTGASAVDIISLIYDGSNFYGSFVQDMQ